MVAATDHTNQVADLDVELNDVAGHLNAQHGRLVDLTVRMLADTTQWQGPGVWTPEQYLAWRVGVAPNRARQIVELARRAHELPTCVDALRRGELSIDQVVPIAKRAPWWTDAQICELAKNLTVSQVRRTVNEYRFPDVPRADDTSGGDGASDDQAPASRVTASDTATPESPDSSDPEQGDSSPQHSAPNDVCRFFVGDDGRFRLYVETDQLTGMVIESALTEARDALFRSTGRTDVDWVDALREVAERSLGSVDSAARRDRFRIGIHLDTSGAAVDARGWRIPDAIRRYVTCDGVLDSVFVENGLPVSVGRRQRIVPERTRRLVVLRDRCCRVPGCTNDRFLEVHHIVHWTDGGPTDTWNLICLCPHHHRLHHGGALGIAGDADQPDGVAFTNHAGRPITPSGARPVPPTGPPPPTVGTYEHPLGERLDGRWLHFHPPPTHAN